MTRGQVDARERRHGPAPWRGSVSPFSWTNAALSASHDGSGDAFLSGGPWGPFRCPGTLTKNVSSGGSSAHGLINRSDSVWLTTEEVHEGPQSIAFPVPPLKRGSVRLESCNGGTVMGPEGPAGPPTLCSSWREKRRLPFQTLFQKTPASLKTSIWGFSRLSAVATRQGDLPYGICLLTFRDPKMEEQYRSTRLIRRTSSTLWISFLFLLVLSSLWPVYGKVLCILGASERISLSFSVGCGALIAAWVFHACIVAFRKKMGISDKAAIQFTLALIALTLLLALGWANVYLGLYAEGRKHDLQVLSDAMHAATAITRQEEPVGITLPSGEIAVLRSSGASPAAESLGGSSSAPDAASEDPEGILGGASGGSRQRSVNFISSVQDKAHDLLHVSTFVMLLIVTLSIVAVYSIADFAPAFLAWSWPFYLAFPILTVATSVVSNVLLYHNLAPESIYMAFLLSTVIWGCGFASRYVCEAEQRAEFCFNEAANRMAQQQAAGGANKGRAAATAVEQLQHMAGSALQLVKAAMVAVAEGAAPYASEGLFLQLQAILAELSTTLYEADDLYSCRIVHSFMDTAAGQRWFSAIRLRSSSLREDRSGSADPSVAGGGGLSFQGRCQGPGSRELIYSSCLLEDWPWPQRCVISRRSSSARRSGSDWYRSPSEGALIEPITRAKSQTCAAAAAFAADAAAGNGGGLCRRSSNDDHKNHHQAAPVSERNMSLPDRLKGAGGEIDATAARTLQTATTPPPRFLTSTATTLNHCQTRRHSPSPHCSQSGEKGADLVGDMLEMQMQPLRTPDGGTRRYNEVAGDGGGRRASHESVTSVIHRPFACSAAFSGIGVDWDMDMLSLAQSHQGTLQHVGWVLLRPFLNVLGCGNSPVLRLMQQVEARYNPDLPYHTATHAAQVAHAAMVLNSKLGLDPGKEKMGSFCLGLAALAHDVGHLGKSNDFLQQSRHPLATIYNDQSIMENFHSSVLFRIINEIPQANVFRCQTPESYQALRQQIIALILATDMKDHLDLVSRCRIKRGSPDFSFLRREEDALHVRKMILKMADLSHALLCWRDHFTWTCKISEEFYRQGDAERRLKLPISPVCNRESHQFLAQNQVAFLKILVEPLLCELEGLEQTAENECPRLPFISDTLRKKYENNVERWTVLDDSGMYIIFDGETLSRGFYRPSNYLDRQRSEGDFERDTHKPGELHVFRDNT